MCVQNNKNKTKQPFLTTMKHLFSSRAFQGLTIGHVCSCFGVYLFLTQLPTYMKEILKFDIKTVRYVTMNVMFF